jgi:curved DNA-binding protein CbpA
VTHYEVLGVRPGADADELRHAYLTLARRHHPDRVADIGARPAAEARMREINEAWAVLGDPERRRFYDEELRVGARRDRRPNAPSPDFVPFDDSPDVDYADLIDDTPIAGTEVPRWLQVLPAGLLAAAVAIGTAGFVAQLGPLLALGLALLVLAGLAFLAAPAVAVMRSYQHDPE